MKFRYVNKIRANVSIYASKRTTNVLDGTYKSVYKGKSMNFENLREYVIGDDVQDIAWKPSARSGTLLIRQFLAEKKHNVLLALDGGKKMSADTNLGENKKTVALLTAGTIGYVAIDNDDLVGMAFLGPEKVELRPFGYSLNSLETCLEEYDAAGETGKGDVNELLEYVLKYVPKRMVVFLITDMDGVQQVRANVLRKMFQRHDLLVVSVNDGFMTGKGVYDVGNEKYVPEFLLEDPKLNEVEHEMREEMVEAGKQKFKRSRISFTEVGGAKEVNEKIVELLRQHRYAGSGLG